MTNTRLEAVLQGLGDGARLEQLVADLLRREDYEVDPTGTRGPDGGCDALLTRNGEQGILHCSISQNWEKKARNDATKAAARSEIFDFFIFATTQNPAGIKRDRVEQELCDEYGWRVKIYDFDTIRIFRLFSANLSIDSGIGRAGLRDRSTTPKMKMRKLAR